MLLFVLVSKVVYAVCCTYVYRAARALAAVYAVCLLLPHILPHIHMYIVLPLPLHLPTSQRALRARLFLAVRKSVTHM